MYGKKHLVRRHSNYDKNSLTDLIVLTMANIEDSLLEAGANPLVDYDYLDLLREAGPFVLSMYNQKGGDPISMTCEWPKPEIA